MLDTAIPGIRRVSYVEDVPRAALDAFEVNPIQRNHLARAHAAATTYLATLQAPHLEFAVVKCIEDGVTYLANGHTRREAWNRAYVAADQIPATINLMTYEADTLEGVEAVYEMFDSAQAVKSKGDKVYGFLRAMDFIPVSPQFAAASWLEMGLKRIYALGLGSMKIQHGGDDWLRGALADWRPEIEAIDALGFGSKVAGDDGKVRSILRTDPDFLAAGLMMVRRDGDIALEFLRRLRDRHGVSAGDDMDPIYTLMAWPASEAKRKLPDTKVPAGRESRHFAEMQLMLVCYEAWREGAGRTFTDFPFPGKVSDRKLVLNFLPFLIDMKAAA